MRLGVTDTLGNTDYWIYECVNKYIYKKEEVALSILFVQSVSGFISTQQHMDTVYGYFVHEFK